MSNSLTRVIPIGPGTPLANPYHCHLDAMNPSYGLSIYESYLLGALAERNPVIEHAFRQITAYDTLVEDQRGNPARGELIQDLRRQIHEYPSYEEGLYHLLLSRNWWIDPSQDGISHINVEMSGKTFLGRSLSNAAPFPIIVPGYGSFVSVLHFWNEVASKVQLHHEYNNKPERPKAADLLVKAIEIKINCYPEIFDPFVQSTQQFVSYKQLAHFSGQSVIQYVSMGWLMTYLSTLRTRFQSGVDKNFKPLKLPRRQ